MVSVSPNPVRGYPVMKSGFSSRQAMASTAEKDPGYFSPGESGKNSLSFQEDSSKKTRKPYTMTKSRESWNEQEHDKFLEALQLFDRDWKKIEAFVGSKSVIQIRSHAQKYFLKVQKNGAREHVPPPRPKRKAAHPYPQKAPKYRQFQASAASGKLAKGNNRMPLWNRNSMAAPNGVFDKERLSTPMIANDCSYISSNESVEKVKSFSDLNDQIDNRSLTRVIPDFTQVYSFLGSVFDHNATDHLHRLKQMDPINLETALLLMRNLSANLNSSEFDKHIKWLSFHGSKMKSSGPEYNDAQTDEVLPSHVIEK